MNERVNPFKKLQKPGKHVKRIVIGAAGLVIIAGLAGDATYQIQEQEQAVLTTFGVPKAVAETGLHFKIPFIQRSRDFLLDIVWEIIRWLRMRAL